MATNNRSDIAIETADRIAVLLVADDGDKHHARALQVINTFKAALELTAPPKMGRPRKPKAEA
jgi:hypothetical protein